MTKKRPPVGSVVTYHPNEHSTPCECTVVSEWRMLGGHTLVANLRRNDNGQLIYGAARWAVEEKP